MTDARMLAMAELIADGYDRATEDDIRELAAWALMQRRDADLERQGRHAAETQVKQLTLAEAMRQANERTSTAFDRDAAAACDRLASEHDDLDDEDYFARATGPTAAEPEWLGILRAAGAL